MIDTFKRYLQNSPGIRTKRKLVVIESDDWGSILMPNKSIYSKLKKSGYKPENNPYFKYDALASETDLEALFQVLNSVKDSKNRPAILTANCVVANPNFEKIKENNYEKYFWEPFTTTLKSYPNHANSFQLWQEGMCNKVFRPQSHGREHLNVCQWMRSLKNQDVDLHQAFDFNMIHINSTAHENRFNYMAALDYFSTEEKNEKPYIIEEGLIEFERVFNYKSLSFIANCYKWDKIIEKKLSELGVKYLQGITSQVLPVLKKNGDSKQIFVKHYFGQKNNFGQRYLIRNAFFEPSLDSKKDWLNDCLKRIDIAFKCKKPAIIGSHRLNYIGFIDENNRTKNLKKLNILLKEIVKRWPTVEFVSTDELDVIFNK
jgi:hypothetical protein